MKQMIIYMAAPYTKGDVAINVRNVILEADRIIEKGHIPFIPHLTHFWHIISPKRYEFWLYYDRLFIPFCDAIYRMPGESIGADKEVEYAKDLKKTIYFEMNDIPEVEGNYTSS